jgi:branched-chain amino acid transport system substrate-binding protein
MRGRHIDRRIVRRASAAVLVVIAACSGSETSTSTTIVATTVTPAAPARLSDGVFRIGILLPRSGPGATFGAPLLAGADVAIDEINRAGGINGELVIKAVEDEGADPADSMQQLLDEADADVIVGPASSNVASNVVGAAVRAGRAVCSPTATAISLSSLPDDGLFLRTIPSEALGVRGLARQIASTGLPTATALVPDDQFGRLTLESLTAELARTSVTLNDPVLYDPDSDDLTDDAVAALASQPSVLVVIGDLANGGRMLGALEAAGNELPPIFVNEALRSHDVLDALSAEGIETLGKLAGNAPAARPLATPAGERFAGIFAAEKQTAPIDFAAYAYDCVMALALAAQATSSDDPQLIAASAAQVTRDGQPCVGFVECAELLDNGRNIDYEGASGPLELDINGDVSEATLEVFGFDDGGEEVVRSLIRVS